MPIKWTIEYDGDDPRGTVRQHLQVILDFLSNGKARIVEEVTDQAEDTVEVKDRAALSLVGTGSWHSSSEALRKDGGCVRAAKGSRRAAFG